jgi:hypothetical protein
MILVNFRPSGSPVWLRMIRTFLVNTSEIKIWKRLIPQHDLSLKVELTSAFLGWLGAREAAEAGLPFLKNKNG